MDKKELEEREKYLKILKDIELNEKKKKKQSKVNYHKCTTLSEWLDKKYDINYSVYKRKPKDEREELRTEFFNDTGVYIADGGGTYDSIWDYYDSINRKIDKYDKLSTINYKEPKYVEPKYVDPWDLHKIGRLHLLGGFLTLCCGIVVTYLFLPWYLWLFWSMLFIITCIACKVGKAFSKNFRRGITNFILSLDVGIVLEALNIGGSLYHQLEIEWPIVISLLILPFSYLTTYLISKHAF